MIYKYKNTHTATNTDYNHNIIAFSCITVMLAQPQTLTLWHGATVYKCCLTMTELWSMFVPKLKHSAEKQSPTATFQWVTNIFYYCQRPQSADHITFLYHAPKWSFITSHIPKNNTFHLAILKQFSQESNLNSNF